LIRDLLDLEPVGRSGTEPVRRSGTEPVFAAPVPHYDKDRPSLYGGQVAAQALRAAALTVADDRPPHSLHCYFVRSGRLDVPLALEVERIRDGRSYTSRAVEAVQGDEVILGLMASFQRAEEGRRFTQPIASVPHPDDLGPVPHDDHGTGFHDPALEMRLVPAAAADADDDRDPLGSTRRFWVRSTEAWERDAPVLAAAYVTYISDLQTGLAVVHDWETQKGRWMLATLDHAVWFHAWAAPEEWLLVDLRPVAVGGNRGLVLGTVHAVDGRHVASFTQEIVARPHLTA
jgi:acyl-CoA thioesterase-2